MIIDEVFCLLFRNFEGVEQFRLESPIPPQFTSWLKQLQTCDIPSKTPISLEGFETDKTTLDIINSQRHFNLEIAVSEVVNGNLRSNIIGPYPVCIHAYSPNAPQNCIYEETDRNTILILGLLAEVE